MVGLSGFWEDKRIYSLKEIIIFHLYLLKEKLTASVGHIEVQKKLENILNCKLKVSNTMKNNN